MSGSRLQFTKSTIAAEEGHVREAHTSRLVLLWLHRELLLSLDRLGHSTTSPGVTSIQIEAA